MNKDYAFLLFLVIIVCFPVALAVIFQNHRPPVIIRKDNPPIIIEKPIYPPNVNKDMYHKGWDDARRHKNPDYYYKNNPHYMNGYKDYCRQNRPEININLN